MKIFFGLALALLSMGIGATSIVEIPHNLNRAELEDMGFVRFIAESTDDNEWVVILYPKTLKKELSPQFVTAIFKQHGQKIVSTSLGIYDFDETGVKSSSFTYAKSSSIEVEIEISYGVDLETSDRIVIGNFKNLKGITFEEYEKSRQ